MRFAVGSSISGSSRGQLLWIDGSGTYVLRNRQREDRLLCFRVTNDALLRCGHRPIHPIGWRYHAGEFGRRDGTTAVWSSFRVDVATTGSV